MPTPRAGHRRRPLMLAAAVALTTGILPVGATVASADEVAAAAVVVAVADCPGVPTAAEVGRPDGLPAPTVRVGTVRTTAPGQVFDNVTFTGRVYVDHPGVVFRNSTLVGDQYFAVYASSPANSFSVIDSDVNGNLRLANGSSVRDTHIYATAAHGLADGLYFDASNVIIDRVVIDGLAGGTGSHIDGIQFSNGSGVSITNSSIDPTSAAVESGGVNASLFVASSTGALADDLTVRCNRIVHAPGSYFPVRLMNAGPGLDFRDNEITDATGTQPVLVGGVRPDPLVWSGNSLSDATPVTIPAPW